MSLKFKKIEISGFKSFADKLEIKFGEGITAIVGPNGCGKSNVADSIRWVLGEQSAKLLRGSSMQDVIFKGTENRKSLSYCEVSLYFDNSEKWFSDLSYEEVVITRKLYRSGESEYYINKQPCLLRTITEYLRDAGMGREGYSIIGQGRVEGLLSAKPEDRRAIFEEAAGISKFKAKKTDAERKLTRTRDNLTRINDILAEKLNTLEPLTKQAETARKYLAFREALQQNEVNLYIYRYETTEAAKSAINERLKAIVDEIDKLNRECDEAAAAYNEAMNNFGSADRNIESLRSQELSLSVGREKLASEINILTERLKYLNKQSAEIMASGEALTREKRITAEAMAQGKTELEKKQFELSGQKQKREKLEDVYFKLTQEIRAYEDKLDANRRELMDAMSRLADIKSNMSSLLTEKSALATRISESKVTLAEEESTLAALREDLKSLESETTALIETKNGLQSEFEKLQSDNTESVEKLASLADQIDALNQKYYTASVQLKMLKAMQEAFEGFNNSVRRLLSAAKKDPSVSNRILGVVAQLLKVPVKYEAAVEVALGAAFQDIVVETEDDADFLIAYLKKNHIGRITFQPISSVKPRSIDPVYRKYFNAPGVLGVAYELVEYDEKYDKVFRALMGGTVVVDKMATAIDLARSTGFAFRIVTLEGDVINPTGAISGGSRRTDLPNIFSHERELETAKADTEECGKKLVELKAERKSETERQQAMAQKLRVCRETLHKMEIDLATKTENLHVLRMDEESRSKRCELLAEDIEKYTSRVNQIDTDINSVGELEAKIEEKKKKSSSISAEGQQHYDELKAQRDEIGAELTECKLLLVRTENVVSSIGAELARLESNATMIDDRLVTGAAQLDANNVLIAELNVKLDSLGGSESAIDTSRLESIRAKLSNLDGYKRELQEKMTAVDARRNELNRMLSELRDKKSDAENQLFRVDSEIEQLQQRVMEEYGLDYEQCLPFKQPDFNVDKGITENNRLKRQIKSLGYVNVAAIEQSKVAYEEYHKMDVQREDLQKAEADLVKIIKEVSDEMLGRFNEQFAKIRENFVKIFRELFDGGTADLVLLESEDPLEAGVEIIAQPPEKKLQSISLLSGGERALTAIAILFSILRLKPMPFCVLDEIEAALDDANAGRFARYLRRFSVGTQFIVITHRKPTMELADNLYGVTMEEKGVSKIVSVKLSEAVAAAESL